MVEIHRFLLLKSFITPFYSKLIEKDSKHSVIKNLIFHNTFYIQYFKDPLLKFCGCKNSKISGNG